MTRAPQVFGWYISDAGQIWLKARPHSDGWLTFFGLFLYRGAAAIMIQEGVLFGGVGFECQYTHFVEY